MTAISLRPHQQAAVDATMDYWAGGGGNPVLMIPTGGGKSYMIAELVRRILEVTPWARIGICIHSKELVEQNYKSLINLLPTAPAGIWSASVGRKDRSAQVLVAGIQSLADNLDKTGGFHVLLVDEAQRVDFNDKENTQYQKLLRANAEIVPNFRVAGITATPWRNPRKPIFGWEKAVFDEMIYEVPIADMIEQGYLVPPVPVTIHERINTKGVPVSKVTGDYVEKALAKVANDDDVNIPAVAKTIEVLKDRNSALVFCTSVAHAERVAGLFNESGEPARVVHGKMKKAERTKVINDFKKGKFRVLVNCAVLLVGFDHPPLDVITILRPSKSDLLVLQLLGRGMRCAPGKVDCLVLDYTDTSEEIGPIDQIRPPAPPQKRILKMDQELIDASGIKDCPVCGALCALALRKCECGHVFMTDTGPDIREEASDAPLMSSQSGVERWVPITSMNGFLHRKHDKPTMLRVVFGKGLKEIANEYLCFGHRGRAREEAVRKWEALGGARPPPDSAERALARVGELSKPTAICVKRNGKYYNVTRVTYQEIKEGEKDG